MYEEFLSINKEKLEQYKKEVIFEMQKLGASEKEIQNIASSTFLGYLYNNKSPETAAKEIAKIERKFL